MKIKTYLPLKIIAICILTYFLVLLSQMIFKYHLTINTTDSLPQGIYFVSEKNYMNLKVGDFVEMKVPYKFRKYVYDRGFLTENMNLLKEVGAISGDRYCINDIFFTINNKKIATVFSKNKFDDDLPTNNGCWQVKDDEFFPLGKYSERSFDGRYMKAISKEYIVGKAIALWIF